MFSCSEYYICFVLVESVCRVRMPEHPPDLFRIAYYLTDLKIAPYDLQVVVPVIIAASSCKSIVSVLSFDKVKVSEEQEQIPCRYVVIMKIRGCRIDLSECREPSRNCILSSAWIKIRINMTVICAALVLQIVNNIPVSRIAIAQIIVSIEVF